MLVGTVGSTMPGRSVPRGSLGPGSGLTDRVRTVGWVPAVGGARGAWVVCTLGPASASGPEPRSVVGVRVLDRSTGAGSGAASAGGPAVAASAASRVVAGSAAAGLLAGSAADRLLAGRPLARAPVDPSAAFALGR